MNDSERPSVPESGGDAADRPDLTVVIPAWNEAHRIARALAEVVGYLRAEKIRAEVLVVDDGSTDGTAEVVRAALPAYPEVRLLTEPTNRGKGAAVRRGVAASRGRYVLFTDTDQSTPMAEWAGLRRALDAGYDVAIASREIAGAVRVVPQPAYRRAMGWVFMALRGIVLIPGFIDSQCGFKAFRGDVARSVFAAATLDGFCFDVEILVIAVHRGHRVIELPVRWTDDRPSRVRPVRDSLRAFADLFRIRSRLARGVYDARA